jgi:hypothetical protein
MLTTWCESIGIGCSIACNLETTCCCRTHVGCVTVPDIGADGVAGCALTISDDTSEIHPAALVV